MVQLCLSQLVPVGEVGLLRDLHVQEEVTFRADSLQVMFVCSAGHPGCPRQPRESRSMRPVVALWTHPTADVRVVRGVMPWAPASILMCSPWL